MVETALETKTANSLTLQYRYHRLLGDLLVDGGFLSRSQVYSALTEQVRSGGRIGDILVARGLLDGPTLKALLRLQRLLDGASDPNSAFHTFLNCPQAFAAAVRRQGGIRLGELLLAEGEITETQLERAIARQRHSEKPLGELLIEAGWLDTRRLGHFLRLQKGLSMALAASALLMGQQSNSMNEMPIPSPAQLAAVPSVAQTRHAYPSVDSRWSSLDKSAQSALVSQSPIKRRQALKEKSRLFREQRLKRQRAERMARSVKALTPAPAKLDPHALHAAVSENARQFSLPVDLIYAIIQTESSFNPNARSDANAWGLMQVVPTAAGAEVHRLLRNCNSRPSARELLDPRTNLYYGTAYLRILLDHYFKDVAVPEVRIGLTIAAYNMGPSRLVTLIERKGVPANVTALRNLLRAHAPRETQDYLDKVLRRRSAFVAFLAKNDPRPV